MILFPALLCALSGVLMLVLSFLEHKKEKKLLPGNPGVYTVVILAISVAVCMYCTWFTSVDVTLMSFLDSFSIRFCQDALGRLFLTASSVIWLVVSIYSCEYMKQEDNTKRFYGFFLLVYSVLICLDSAGNLITFYFFYEFMTLTSLPLVLHHQTKEALMAGLKYLLYSMAGAYFALFGIYVLSQNTATLDFIPGGSLQSTSTTVMLACFFLILGFGAKAGMLPLHAWLPTAHPAAPAPASAALSAIIVKGGVLAIIRSIFYVAGAQKLRGTWVQSTWMVLALLTVFMGSMIAFRQKEFKKRLAYSTVSQASYILFGLSLLEPMAFTGALLHFVFHACIKAALFLTAGAFIFHTGKHQVSEYPGIGKKLPMATWGYTLASLGLIGIPPVCGFISKWYLALGSLQSDTGVISVIGPVVLLVSALLTAGYLLPIMWNGFFGAKAEPAYKNEWKSPMSVSIALLALLAVWMGVFPDRLVEYMAGISCMVFGK